MKKALVGTALALLANTASADAALLTIAPTAGDLQAFQTPPAGTVLQKNDVIPGLWGYLNANLFLEGVEGQQYKVTFTLFGSESGATNALVSGGNTLTEPGVPGDSFSIILTGGADPVLIPFRFTTPSEPAWPDVVNGANFPSTAERSFFVSLCQSADDELCNVVNGPITGNFAWLALDDSGAGPNDNHDDWVGYVTVEQVPEPTTTLAFGMGLVALAARLRRRR